MSTVRESFENMPQSFQPEAAEGLDVTYQFNITGEGGGKWYAQISEGQLDVVEGQQDEPNVIISMQADDYVNMVNGKLPGQIAFMTGKLKVKGDLALAYKMKNIFKQG